MSRISMSRMATLLSGFALLAVVLVFAGCGSSGDDGPSSGGDPKIEANLAKLSAEDRALAEKQKVCAVEGEPLGSMGVPIKVDVQGQPVFICCEGCRDKLLDEPDKFLAKLKK